MKTSTLFRAYAKAHHITDATELKLVVARTQAEKVRIVDRTNRLTMLMIKLQKRILARLEARDD
jgi:hypothetical protein